MSKKPEGLPESESEDTPPSEREPISYEQALAAAKVLFEAGVKDPTIGEYKDTKVKDARSRVAEWARDNDLHVRRIGTVEKARKIVQFGKIWLEAGYKAPAAVRTAMEYVNDAYSDAL